MCAAWPPCRCARIEDLGNAGLTLQGQFGKQFWNDKYLYDGSNVVEEQPSLYGGPWGLLAGLGLDDNFMTGVAESPSGPGYSIVKDAQNSTIGLTDPSGTLFWQNTYDPYGNSPYDATTDYQFAGRELSIDGLYYMRA